MEENKINESVSIPIPTQTVESAIPTPGMPSAPVGVVYAGFWRRVLAYIIDVLIVGIPLSIIERILGINGNISFTSAPQNIGMFLPILFSLVLGWLYYSLMESSKKQATLGKMAIGIKVTDIDGQKISFARATGRHFAKIISSIILGIGYIMVAFTSKKQGLHDMIAGTLVVKK